MHLRPRFGELLSRLTALSRHDVEEILHEQGSTSRRFGEIALAWGLCRPEHVWNAWCDQLAHNGEKIDLKRIAIDSRALACIAPALARELKILPIRLIDDTLILAAAELNSERAMPPIQKKLRFVLADAQELELAIGSHYPR